MIIPRSAATILALMMSRITTIAITAPVEIELLGGAEARVVPFFSVDMPSKSFSL